MALSSVMFNLFFNSGFDADKYLEDIVKGKSRYSLAQEGAKEELSRYDQQILRSIDKPMKVLIIGSPLCSDTAVAVPSFLEIFQKMENWEYSIIDKRDIEKDYLYTFKVGSKATVPQIFFANKDGEVIDKWIEKSKRAKILLNEIKESNLESEAKKERILTTPELNSKVESKAVVKEIINLAQKAIHYI